MPLSLILACLVIPILACGGGGGGEDSFAGTWRTSMRIAENGCNLNLPSAFSNEILVNQDKDIILVQSGVLVFSGAKNDKGGFNVANQNVSNGCSTASVFVSQDIKDGEGDIAYGIESQCGNSSCRVLYGGRMYQESNKSITEETDISFEDLDNIMTSEAIKLVN